MVRWPVRATPVSLVTARTFTVPEPATGIAVGVVSLTTSQLTSDVAVQVHVPSGAVTVITQFASLPLTVFEAPSSVTVPHAPVLDGAGASCVRANAWPPTSIAALRAAPALDATVYDTVPAPVPDALAESSVSQLVAVEAADHVHEGSDAVTANVPLPPLDG